MKDIGFSVIEDSFVTFTLRYLARGLTKQFAEQATPATGGAQTMLDPPNVPPLSKRFQHSQPIRRAGLDPYGSDPRAALLHVPQPLLLLHLTP